MREKLLKVSDFIIYYSIILIPFLIAIAPAVTFGFMGLLLFAFIIKKTIKKNGFLISTPVNLPFFILFLISVISFKNSVDYNASFRGLTKLLEHVLLFLICAEEIKDKRQFSWILLSVFLGASLISIDGLWQIKFGRDFIRGNTLQSAIGLIRPTASFPNPNVMGIYLTAIAPIIFGVTFFYAKGKIKLPLMLGTALTFTSIYLTFSRGAGVGVYAAILFLTLARKKWIISLLLILVLLIFPFIMPENIRDWAKEVGYHPLVFMCNYDRISFYKNTLNMIKHHPFIGVGVNTFCQSYKKYRLPESEKNMTSDSIYAHNIYLHMAGEIGLLGLSAFIFLLFQVFRVGIKAYQRFDDEFLKIISISLLACLLAFLINGLTETSLYYSRVAMIFWYIVGMVLALGRRVLR